MMICCPVSQNVYSGININIYITETSSYLLIQNNNSGPRLELGAVFLVAQHVVTHPQLSHNPVNFNFLHKRVKIGFISKSFIL